MAIPIPTNTPAGRTGTSEQSSRTSSANHRVRTAYNYLGNPGRFRPPVAHRSSRHGTNVVLHSTRQLIVLINNPSQLFQMRGAGSSYTLTKLSSVLAVDGQAHTLQILLEVRARAGRQQQRHFSSHQTSASKKIVNKPRATTWEVHWHGAIASHTCNMWMSTRPKLLESRRKLLSEQHTKGCLTCLHMLST